MSFDIREHLDKLEINPKDKTKFFCPACGGHNLSVNGTTGAYNCFNDDSEKHRAEIRENISPSELKRPRPKPGNRSWTYPTISGEPVTRIYRTDREAGDKEVKRINLAPELLDQVIPLYWEECLTQLDKEGGHVFLVEGEDTADMARSIGMNAITLYGGSVGYRPEVYQDLFFQIRHSLVLVPDMDKAGMKVMMAVHNDFPEAQWLYVTGPNHYRWGTKRLAEKNGYDIGDEIRNGTTIEQLYKWIHPRQAFALSGEALEVDIEVNTMLEGLRSVFAEVSDPAVREIKVAQFVKKSGLRDLGWNIQRALRYCYCEQHSEGALEVLDAHEMINMPTKKPRWIIPGFLPAGSVILLAADGGTGKTTLLYNLSKSIALGQEWSGFPVVKGKVLIVSTDEPSHDTKEKLKTIDYSAVPRGAVQFIRFWKFGQIDQLEDEIRRMEPSLVIIDSLTSTTAGASADRTSSSAGDCLYLLRDLAEKFECSFVILHHLNKLGDLRDSTTYRDNVSEAWKLSRDESSGDFTLEYPKSRNSFQGKAVLRRRIQQYEWTMVGRVGSHVPWAAEQALAKFITDKLCIDGTDNWLTAEQIALRYGGASTLSLVNSILPVLRLTGRISCESTVVNDVAVLRYAAWNANPKGPKQEPVADPIVLPFEEEATDDFDDLLMMIQEGMSGLVSPREMNETLECYEWPEGGKALFWRMLDQEARAWLQSEPTKPLLAAAV